MDADSAPARRRAGARLAAVLALLLVGLAAIPLAVLAVNVPDLLVVLACLFVATYCVWLLVTRPGLVQVPAVLGLGGALAGLAYLAYDHRIELAAAVGTLALFGLAARAAVRGDAGARSPSRPVPPARHGVLVINPRSGDGKAGRAGLAAEAERRGIATVTLAPGDDLRAVVEDAIAGGADVVGMAGGDGSQGVVAAVASARGVAHVCVPAGTRNHFALDLGLDRDDVLGALDAFTDGVERQVDLATVNDRVFVNNVSLGVYADVVQSETYRGAKLGTWRRLLPALLSKPPDDLRFARPDLGEQDGATLLLVSNNPYELRRIRVAGSRPRLDTGRLGILSAQLRDADGFARFVTLSAVGQEWRMRDVRQWTAAGFEVTAAGPVPVGLDGEALRMTPPLRFASRPGALRVRLPATAPGVSPAGAAVSLSRRDLERLVRIAAGR
ncbi:MAG TPA: diacylglycerol kinase family protein [Mycobacteriales bacterium]|nr:diacylglycerol kinase family protein [Mycobacteriales bacterium]